MNEDIVKVDVRDRIATITLNRPPVNALSREMWYALSAAYDTLNSEEVHVGVLTSAFDRAFCAGADLDELLTDDQAARDRRHEVVTPIQLKIRSGPVPVVCAINGPAVGAGLALMAHCDYRISVDTAHFSMTEVDRGTAAGGGAALTALGVPSGFMREMLYTGRRVTAAEALHVNLVDRVVSAEELWPTTRAVAGAMAVKARNALRILKQAILLVDNKVGWLEKYGSTHQLTDEIAAQAEAREGISAFLNKHDPAYMDD